MKNFVKKAGAWLAVTLIVGLLAVPAFASGASVIVWMETNELNNPDYYDINIAPQTTGNYDGVLYYCFVENVEVGTYVVDGVGLSDNQWSGTVPITVFVAQFDAYGNEDLRAYPFGTSFEITETTNVVIAQSLGVPPVLYRDADDLSLEGGFYYTVRELLQFYFYGDAELAPEHVLTLNCLSTAAVLAIVVMPFVLVYFVIKLISGR